MTHEQQTIITALIEQFEKFNTAHASDKHYRYFDPTPIINEALKIDSEKEQCEIVFKINLDAFNLMVSEQFQALQQDLCDVLNVSYKKVNHQKWAFSVSSKTLITCIGFGVQIKLSDGKTYASYGVKPSYCIHNNDGTLWEFKSFEEMVSSDKFNDAITKLIKNK